MVAAQPESRWGVTNYSSKYMKYFHWIFCFVLFSLVFFFEKIQIVKSGFVPFLAGMSAPVHKMCVIVNFVFSWLLANQPCLLEQHHLLLLDLQWWPQPIIFLH